MSHEKYKHIGYPVDRMIEEIGEILQAIGKGKRFGWNSHHPDRPYQTNLDELNNEITDLLDAFNEFKEALNGKEVTPGKDFGFGGI